MCWIIFWVWRTWISEFHKRWSSGYHCFPFLSCRFSVFAHLSTFWFIKGLSSLLPCIRQPTTVWDLKLVLSPLMKPSFKPPLRCSLLSMKTAFLVAITSTRIICQLEALMDDFPYTIFYKEIVSCWPDPCFLLKVILDFHKQPGHSTSLLKLEKKPLFRPQISEKCGPLIWKGLNLSPTIYLFAGRDRGALISQKTLQQDLWLYSLLLQGS